MPLKDVKQDVVDVLEAASVGSTSTNPPTLYRGPYPASAPDAMVAVVELGDSGEDVEYLGRNRHVLVHEITVQVRGPRNNFAAAEEKATAAWEANVATTPAGYVRWRPESKPVHLGPDEMGRHRFTFTLRVEYGATASPGSLTPDA
jgi:hypothetical protein